jgi:hypothetical protein
MAETGLNKDLSIVIIKIRLINLLRSDSGNVVNSVVLLFVLAS